MKAKYSFFLILASIFLVFLTEHAYANVTIMVSPLPGEGFAQIAKRHHVSYKKLLALNKHRLVNSARPSLIYTWQKFELPTQIVKKSTHTHKKTAPILASDKSANNSTISLSKSASTEIRHTEKIQQSPTESFRFPDLMIFSMIANILLSIILLVVLIHSGLFSSPQHANTNFSENSIPEKTILLSKNSGLQQTFFVNIDSDSYFITDDQRLIDFVKTETEGTQAYFVGYDSAIKAYFISEKTDYLPLFAHQKLVEVARFALSCLTEESNLFEYVLPENNSAFADCRNLIMLEKILLLSLMAIEKKSD